MPATPTVATNLRLPVAVAEALDAEARRSGRTKTEIVVAALTDALAKEATSVTETEAYFAEGERDGSCITYPVTITTDHSASSYGHPVVVIDGEALGPADLPSGELQLTAEQDATWGKRLARSGYAVCTRHVDEDWRERWDAGEEVGEDGFPNARYVQF